MKNEPAGERPGARDGTQVKEVVSIRMEPRIKEALVKRWGGIQAWVDEMVIQAANEKEKHDD